MMAKSQDGWNERDGGMCGMGMLDLPMGGIQMGVSVCRRWGIGMGYGCGREMGMGGIMLSFWPY